MRREAVPAVRIAQAVDEAGGLGALGGGADLAFAGVRAAIRDVVGQRAVLTIGCTCAGTRPRRATRVEQLAAAGAVLPELNASTGPRSSRLSFDADRLLAARRSSRKGGGRHRRSPAEAPKRLATLRGQGLSARSRRSSSSARSSSSRRWSTSFSCRTTRARWSSWALPSPQRLCRARKVCSSSRRRSICPLERATSMSRSNAAC